MKTAKEMVKYVDEHGLGKGMTKKWRLKHFAVAEQQLNSDEEVLACFIGLHNYISASKHDNYFGYVITNKRFIMTQKKVMGENVKIVSRKHLNDVSKETRLGWGILTFDTFKETFNIAITKDIIDNVHNIVNTFLFSDSTPVSDQSQPTQSVAEQLKEFKELLDLEIITQEEFDKKKAELLG